MTKNCTGLVVPQVEKNIDSIHQDYQVSGGGLAWLYCYLSRNIGGKHINLYNQFLAYFRSFVLIESRNRFDTLCFLHLVLNHWFQLVLELHLEFSQYASINFCLEEAIDSV